MRRSVAMRDIEDERIADAAAEASAKLAEAKSALWQVRRQAADLAAEARARTREVLSRRRSETANRLEQLAEAVRPSDDPTERRRRLAVTGGSSLALAGAVCVGAALGYAFSRGLRKRKAIRAEAKPTAVGAQARAELPRAGDPSTDSLPRGATGLP